MPTKAPFEYWTDQEVIMQAYQHLYEAMRAAHSFDFRVVYLNMNHAYRLLKSKVNLYKNERMPEGGDETMHESR